jgi:Zn-dependent M28 family amino/carboxypeptidase
VLAAMVGAAACGSRVQPRAEAPPAPEQADPMDASRMMAEVELLSSPRFRGRGSYQAGARMAADYLVDELESLGYRVLRQPVRGKLAENIIAIKRGDDEAVMVSAHHDHLGIDASGTMYPGADDNASGVAVLLAIARSVAHTRFRHTILFASFGAEEDGLVGSGVYVHNPLWPLDKTAAVINFDMVGRDFFEAGSGREAACAIVGLESAPTAARLARAGARKAGLALIEVPARLLELFHLHDRTDDWWFRRQRIPSIHFSTGLHLDYHTPADTPAKIVPAQLERIGRAAATIVEGLAVPVGDSSSSY